ncbi:MAG TPA: MucB/RseB C-terminal domain-containing protein [Nevskiaceae bacterium]|nr:MucB/RseB C-terminal domain-containing protein [Nevskiaceae bacterium]
MRRLARTLSSRWISGAAIALLSTAAVADDGAVEWLVRMGDAARTMNYEGVLVYRDDDVLETLSLLHSNRDGQERERLISLSGEPREIQRQNDEVTCLLPKQQAKGGGGASTHQHGLFPHMTRETVAKLSDHYEVKLIGNQRVAGRLCQGVQIKPKDNFRYGYQFWADQKTGVPLKVLLTTRENARMEELVFTQVDFPKRIPGRAFDASADKGDCRPAAKPTSAKAKASAPRFDVEQLPPGFQVTVRDTRTLPDQRGEVEHVLVSDGLSAVSVFLAFQPPPERFFQGFSRMGAVHAYGRMLGEYHVAVVGEVPMETVRMIGDGLRAADDEGGAARMSLIPPTP